MEHLEHNHTALFQSRREQIAVFFLVFIGVLSLTYGFFFAIDFLPEKPGTNAEVIVETPTTTVAETIAEVEPEEQKYVDPFPLTIIFDSLEKREVEVLNPDSTSVAALDAALLEGVVRHPDSADFENTGTIFLLGHSSYLPKVFNKNFQAFNGIQDLKWGDTIRLRSSDTEYVYRVDRMYKALASDAEVKIEQGVAKLTLATCNSFGSKDDRFVVESTLIESYPIVVADA